MGRPAKYEPAARQLRERLEDARAEGLAFDVAWERAVRPDVSPIITTNTPECDRPAHCVVWPADTRDRHAILTTVIEARVTWQRAYERTQATPAEHALILLASQLRLEDYEDEPIGAAG